MKRTPMKRTAWPRKSTPTLKKAQNREQRLTERAQAAIKSVVMPPRNAVFTPTVPTTVRAVPKSTAHRNKHLRELARGMPCLLRIRGVCNGDWSTTVACHSNLSIHGKAGARKADDHYTVWGCAACHSWLDQGRADGVLKETGFTYSQMMRLLAEDGTVFTAEAEAAIVLQLDAYPAICERLRKTGRVGLTGPELKIARDAAEVMDGLIDMDRNGIAQQAARWSIDQMAKIRRAAAR